MKKRVVGLDIAGRSIRGVQMLHRTGQRSIVEKFVDFPLDEFDATFDKTRANYLARNLRDMWNQAGFKTPYLAVGIGGGDVFVREFSVPDVSPNMLKKRLPDLLKSELPMSVDEVVLDFYANSRTVVEGEPSLQGLAVAANRKVVDELMEASRAAKLKVVSIDLIPFALTRHLMKRKIQTGVKAYVRASNSYINIVVTDGTKVVFVRLVPWEHLGNRELKLSDAATGDNEGLVFESAEPSTGELALILEKEQSQLALQRQAIRELNETMEYFHLNHSDKKIEEILVSGYRLDNAQFIEALSKDKNIWVTGITKTGLGHKKSTLSLVDTAELPDHLAVALALAEGVDL